MDQPVQINRSVVRRGTDLLRSLVERKGGREEEKEEEEEKGNTVPTVTWLKTEKVYIFQGFLIKACRTLRLN